MKLDELADQRRKEEYNISKEQNNKMAKVLEEFLSGARKEIQGKTLMIFNREVDGFPVSTDLEEIMEKGEAAGVVKIVKIKDVAESDNKDALFDCIDAKDIRHPVFDGMVLAEIV